MRSSNWMTLSFLLACAAASVSGARAGDRPASRIQLADDGTARMCQQAYNNATECYRSWQNIGGGSTGQAGSFQQCYQVYCQALVAGGCDAPLFCR